MTQAARMRSDIPPTCISAEYRLLVFFLSDFTSTKAFYDIELFTVYEAGHVKQAPLARRPILQTLCRGIQPHLQMYFPNEQLQGDKD